VSRKKHRRHFRLQLEEGLSDLSVFSTNISDTADYEMTI